MKNLYYKKFYNDSSDFSDDFLQEDLYSSEINYSLIDNESFFNNNIECYNYNVKFLSNNQLHNYLTECKLFISQISDKHLVVFTHELRTQTD